jgi:hypothetical protein
VKSKQHSNYWKKSLEIEAILKGYSRALEKLVKPKAYLYEFRKALTPLAGR